jgi:hypothetical protein
LLTAVGVPGLETVSAVEAVHFNKTKNPKPPLV